MRARPAGSPARPGRDDKLRFEGREIVVDAFPISIEVDRYQAMATDPEIIVAAERLPHYRVRFSGSNFDVVGPRP